MSKTPGDIVPEAEDGRIGTTLGNLILDARIGVGGMGAVYRAQHRVLETAYAVKILHPAYSEDADAVDRFRSEAIAASRLRHPNVVFVTDFGFSEELGLYIVMEHLEGFTLKALIRSAGGLTLGRMVHIGSQLCGALAAAHRLNIVHRDIKPENVMVLSDISLRDTVKILDFGIARLRDRSEEEEEDVLGTPQYMAPEQITGRSSMVSPSVDIYALGMVFYAMLMGQPAFEGSSPQEILEAQLQKTPPSIGTEHAHLTGTLLESLVQDMLAKTPEKRPESLDVVHTRLNDALQELIDADVAGSIYTPSMEDEWAGDEMTAVWTGAVSGTIRMTTVIKQICAVGPQSAAAILLDAIPSLETLKGEALCLALWGVIQQELLEFEPGTDEFQLGLDQLVLLIQAILESNDGPTPSEAQNKIFRALRSTLPIFSDERRSFIRAALRPLAASPHYPRDMLEDEFSGSWNAFKKVMATEIHLPWARNRSPAPPVLPREQPSDAALSQMSLLQKLKQDVSMRSINALLSHEVSFFGGEDEELPALEDREEDA